MHHSSDLIRLITLGTFFPIPAHSPAHKPSTRPLCAFYHPFIYRAVSFSPLLLDDRTTFPLARNKGSLTQLGHTLSLSLLFSNLDRGEREGFEAALARRKERKKERKKKSGTCFTSLIGADRAIIFPAAASARLICVLPCPSSLPLSLLLFLCMNATLSLSLSLSWTESDVASERYRAFQIPGLSLFAVARERLELRTRYVRTCGVEGW